MSVFAIEIHLSLDKWPSPLSLMTKDGLAVSTNSSPDTTREGYKIPFNCCVFKGWNLRHSDK